MADNAAATSILSHGWSMGLGGGNKEFKSRGERGQRVYHPEVMGLNPHGRGFMDAKSGVTVKGRGKNTKFIHQMDNVRKRSNYIDRILKGHSIPRTQKRLGRELLNSLKICTRVRSFQGRSSKV